MPNIYFKWSLVEFFNFDVFLSLKVILILINSTDPDELPYFRSSLFAFRIQILPYMGVCRALRLHFNLLAMSDKDLVKCTCPDLKCTSPDLKCANFQII